MKNYVFSIGIIPVQEFIAEARRSRDLKAGSVFLSWSMAKVLNYLQQNSKFKNVKVILPSFSEKKIKEKGKLTFEEEINRHTYSIPNRASGYFSSKPDDAKTVFENLDQFLTELWHEFSEESKKWIKEKDHKFAKQYLDTLNVPPIQIVWVFTERDLNKIDATNLESIDKLYADIKRSRPIRAWQGAPIAKCTQCGKREVIGPSQSIKEWREWVKKIFLTKSWVKKEYRIDENERLCQVCFLKRLAGYLDKKKTGSTNEITTREWLYRIEKLEDLNSVLLDLKKLQQPLDMIDQVPWFFPSVIRKMKNDEDKKEILDKIERTQKKISNTLRKNTHFGIAPKPSDYLAVITYDGDDMGEHSRKEGVSEKIAKFAEKIFSYFSDENSRKGEIFYMGGDEGLILTPIETVMDTANQIRQGFSNLLGNEITLSMGISIFHRERPLGAAIRLAQYAIDKSKQFFENYKRKNALTVCIQTASGNVFDTTARWGAEWERFRNILMMLQAEESKYGARLSMAWPYEVERSLISLLNADSEWSDHEFRQAIKTEVKRITFRKLDLKNGNSQEKQDRKRKIWEEMFDINDWMSVHSSENYLSNLSSQLHLLAFLARESGLKNFDDSVKPEVHNE